MRIRKFLSRVATYNFRTLNFVKVLNKNRKKSIKKKDIMEEIRKKMLHFENSKMTKE